jgi:prephenate dehydratase
MNKTIAFQGERGAYSEAAALEYLGPGTATRPCQSFEAVFEAVAGDGGVDGLIPIENSLAGSIHRNYDLLLESDLQIVGEYSLRVSHCLMAPPGVALADLRRVYSHPQALGQCRKRLTAMGLEPVASYDTAGSARMLSEQGIRDAGALASHLAAQVYGLEVLAAEMEDDPANFTRFLLISQEARSRTGQEYKTSLAFSLQNRPGALFEALRAFAERGIDLTKLESRPLAGRPWEYMFYIDFIGHPQDSISAAALADLADFALSLRLLGAYPRAEG